MNLLIKLCTAILLTVATSCDSTKTAVEQTEPYLNNVKEMNSKLVNEGYLSGIVKFQENSECSYVLIDEQSKLIYDPINIDEEKFKTFKKDAGKVYFKILPLRRMNRCSDAQPVQLVDLLAREE